MVYHQASCHLFCGQCQTHYLPLSISDVGDIVSIPSVIYVDPPTVLHILNACPTSLNQGRLTWRHDSVLLKIVQGITPVLSEGDTMYADLQGYRACDNPPATIPLDIMVTSAHHDLVILRHKEILLIELSIPYNSPESLSNARKRKMNKENYQVVPSELDSKGVKTSLTTLEIGALGHSFTQTHSDLRNVLPCLTSHMTRQLFDDAGKTSIYSSHTIFRARNDLSWASNRPLLN